MVTLDDPKVRAALDDELPRMSFGDHLDELRGRLIKALLAVFVAVFGVIPFKQTVQGIVTEPYRVQWRALFVRHVDQLEQEAKDGVLDPEGQGFLAYCREHRVAILAGEKKYKATLPSRTGFPVPYTLQSLGGLDDTWMWMTASLVFALVLAAPVVGWQAWAFVAAGLYPQERRLFYRFFPFMIGLGAAGVLFGYRIALPYTLEFLISLMPEDQVGAMLGVGQYFTLLFAMTAAMGVVFQLPLVMVALQKVGLVTHAAWRQHWRITLLVIFLIAAVFTPPDPMSMMLMAAPMLVLYLLGLALTWFGRRRDAAVAP